jgi:hypothetical protein
MVLKTLKYLIFKKQRFTGYNFLFLEALQFVITAFIAILVWITILNNI